MGAEVVSGLAWHRDGSLLAAHGSTLQQVPRLIREEVLAARKMWLIEAKAEGGDSGGAGLGVAAPFEWSLDGSSPEQGRKDPPRLNNCPPDVSQYTIASKTASTSAKRAAGALSMNFARLAAKSTDLT